MKKTLAFSILLITLAACSGSGPTSEATGKTSQALTPSGDLVFTPGFVAPGWLPVSSLDLSPAWAAAGLQETGTGYFSVGAPTQAPFLDRFNPTAPTYLDFFGGYVVKNFKYAADWLNPDGSQKTNMTVADAQNSANELVALGNVDQFAWLSAFPPAPVESSLVPGSLIILPAATLFPALDGWFFLSFEISTVSELGADPANVSPNFSAVYPSFSQFSSLVAPFHPYVAEAFVLIKYDAPSGDFLAVYGNGANWRTLDGKDHNTPIGTILQIRQMMSQVTFQ